MDSLQDDAARVEALGVLSRFRVDFHGCLTARGDELSELADALLCTEGPVKTLVGLSLAPEHRRGHGALYDGVNRGRIDFARLRKTLACLPRRGPLTGGSCWPRMSARGCGRARRPARTGCFATSTPVGRGKLRYRSELMPSCATGLTVNGAYPG